MRLRPHLFSPHQNHLICRRLVRVGLTLQLWRLGCPALCPLAFIAFDTLLRRAFCLLGSHWTRLLSSSSCVLFILPQKRTSAPSVTKMSWKLTKSMFSWSPLFLPWRGPSYGLFFSSPTLLQSNADFRTLHVELKETHLAPLTQSFRSSSTSTIKGESGEEAPPISHSPSVETPPSDGICMCLQDPLHSALGP